MAKTNSFVILNFRSIFLKDFCKRSGARCAPLQVDSDYDRYAICRGAHRAPIIMQQCYEIKNVSRAGLDLQPKYQREYIWKDDFKDKLIYSIVRGYPIGNVSIGIRNNPNVKKAMSEVVDGQQRLTTIFNLVNEGYEVKPEYAKRISVDIIDYLNDVDGDKELEVIKKKALSDKRFKLTFSMLPEIIKDNIRNYQLSISNISVSTEEQIAEYFRFLQNQEILRAGEIINSLPDTNFENFLFKLADKEKFMRVVGYKDDKRRDFDKIFYASIGILDESIPFGATDTTIKKYITETSSIMAAQTQKRVDSMIMQINCITELDNGTVEKTNKRFMKLLILLLGLDNFYFAHSSLSSALKKLALIDKRLSSFFSAKKDVLSSTFTVFDSDPKTFLPSLKNIDK